MVVKNNFTKNCLTKIDVHPPGTEISARTPPFFTLKIPSKFTPPKVFIYSELKCFLGSNIIYSGSLMLGKVFGNDFESQNVYIHNRHKSEKKFFLEGAEISVKGEI